MRSSDTPISPELIFLFCFALRRGTAIQIPALPEPEAQRLLVCTASKTFASSVVRFRCCVSTEFRKTRTHPCGIAHLTGTILSLAAVHLLPTISSVPHTTVTRALSACRSASARGGVALRQADPSPPELLPDTAVLGSRDDPRHSCREQPQLGKADGPNHFGIEEAVGRHPFGSANRATSSAESSRRNAAPSR